MADISVSKFRSDIANIRKAHTRKISGAATTLVNAAKDARTPRLPYGSARWKGQFADAYKATFIPTWNAIDDRVESAQKVGAGIQRHVECGGIP